jgi:hypothetical protein
VLHTLTGFENNNKDGSGSRFNLILSNGDRSKQRDEGYTYYDHMMTADSHKRIRSVNIHFNPGYCITGFYFYDKDDALIWRIGHTDYCCLTRVLLGENEVIVGMVAKLCPGKQSWYSDF